MHLRKPELGPGAVGADAIVTGKRELEPAAKTRPVNGDDEGVGKVRQFLKKHLHLAAQSREFPDRR